MLSRPQATLLALLAVSSLTQASWFDEALDDIIKRQDDSAILPSLSGPVVVLPGVTSSTTSQPPRSTQPSTTTDQPPTTSPPQSSTTTPVTTTSAPPSSSSSETTTAPPSPTPSSSSPSVMIETPTPTPSSTNKPTAPVTTPTPTVIRVTLTETVNGQVLTSVSESTSTILPTSTNAAELNKSSEQSGGGMSSKTRGTIIGVVVGIGGAVLLGGLAVVAYRIWGRKKSGADGDDFPDYSRPDTGMDKAGGSSAGGSTNPFQSTLESYHNPAKVNASSNF